MPRNRKPNSTSQAPGLDPEAAVRLLNRQKERGTALAAANSWDSVAAEGWYNTTREMLTAAFGAESRNIMAVMHAGPPGQIYPMGTPQGVMDAQSRRRLAAAAQMLDSCVEQLELLSSKSAAVAEPVPGEADLIPKAFIVHGHDQGRKDTVARFLGDFGLKPIVLHEQANLGLTLIEKFELYADVPFAVVVLTGDDLGSPAANPGINRARARQNVVFELGYFIGRLGRKMVCTLYEEGVEIPSDYQGIVYIPLDERGAWRMLLARELKAAGFNIDLNRAL